MKKRIFGPDLVRAVAVTFVVGVHAFAYTGFYDVPLQGAGMVLAAFIRMALMTCVPLFLMLTGYLCLNKKFSAEYYLGIVPTLAVYLIASAACLAWRVTLGGESISFLGMLRRVLDYSAAPYAWYVEMYIGLFLLCPFINAGWHAMGEGMKKACMITLVCLSSLHLVVNLWVKILPDWWGGLYPITYYVIGAWFRENPAKYPRSRLLLGFLLMTALTTALQLVLFGGGLFSWSASNNRGSILVMGETVFLFAFLMSADGEKWPHPAKRCVETVAKLSFGIYLLSYISDMLIYPFVTRWFNTPVKALAVLPVCTAAGLVISGVMAWGAEKLAKYLVTLAGKVFAPLVSKTAK